MSNQLKFAPLEPDDAAGVERMSALASSIVKEHFDPIIGEAQNDYMIERFQSPAAIAGMLSEGYRYFFVEGPDGDEMGFIAYVPHDDSLYLSKFYLRKDARGRGYAHEMMGFVAQAARDGGFGTITLNVNRGNDARFAYEKMGFRIIRAEANDIGEGYVMDDYVYELRV